LLGLAVFLQNARARRRDQAVAIHAQASSGQAGMAARVGTVVTIKTRNLHFAGVHLVGECDGLSRLVPSLVTWQDAILQPRAHEKGTADERRVQDHSNCPSHRFVPPVALLSAAPVLTLLVTSSVRWRRTECILRAVRRSALTARQQSRFLPRKQRS
jgi:hypothetical protein